jgi:hypothetical protein
VLYSSARLDTNALRMEKVYNAPTLQIAYTDIDQLEKVVHILAHGDIMSENTRELTEVNFLRIFRLAQLVIEYLLHVQDTLASERHRLLALECGLFCSLHAAARGQ